uniref:Response regulatory domain-containing protein n=1 Tax=Populus alba TaxID=43335 RepID=A0A4U5N9I9_POPAL|nr:uncharacterized protein D5086_0000269890 [Populus alba]
MLAKPPRTSMTSQDNTQIDLEIKTLLGQLNGRVTNLEKKITSAESFKAEIEALVNEARKSQHSSTARRNHLDKARQLLMQKIEEFKKEEDTEDRGLTKTDAMGAPSDLTGNRVSQKDHKQIQILATEVDRYIAEIDRKVNVLEDPSYLTEEIRALNVDRVKAESLKLFLQSSDRKKDLEVRRRIAYVNQWLNHKTESDKSGDSSIKYHVLVVDDDSEGRETLRELFMSLKSETTPTLDVQVAKNGKEAVYLHLAGASFDMIVMDDLMPVMNGIEATKQLFGMGVVSYIVGVGDDTVKQAFIDAGIDQYIEKPLTPAKYIAEVDRKVKVLENPFYPREEIKALDADRVKAESLKLFLQSSDRRKDLEVRRRIAYVNQWLNHSTEIVKSGDSESEGNKYSVLVVDDSCDDRETLRKLFMWIESETKLPIVFQVAKNGKEAVIFIMLGLVLI